MFSSTPDTMEERRGIKSLAWLRAAGSLYDKSWIGEWMAVLLTLQKYVYYSSKLFKLFGIGMNVTLSLAKPRSRLGTGII